MSSQPLATKGSDWIHYSLSHNSLGLLLLAYSQRGVCYLSMGDQLPLLESQLLNKYPQAQRLDTDTDLQKLGMAGLKRHSYRHHHNLCCDCSTA